MYGIGAIKGVGEGPIEAIIEARNNGGYFRELFDLCARTDIKKTQSPGVGKKLIMSGAFDRLGPHRAALMNSLNDALKAADQHAKAEAIGRGGYVRRAGGRAGTNRAILRQLPAVAGAGGAGW